MKRRRVVATIGVLVASVFVTGLVAVSTHGSNRARNPRQAVHCFDITTTWDADGSVSQSWIDAQGHRATSRIPPLGRSRERSALVSAVCEVPAVSRPAPFDSGCRPLIGNLGPLVDGSGNGGHLTSCRTVRGKTYVIPWYGGFPSAQSLDAGTRPTAATCFTAAATGLGHDAYAVIVYERRPMTGRYAHSWVPVRATWSDRPCQAS